MINKELAKSRGLDKDTIKEIESLHSLRNKYYKEMVEEGVDLKRYDSLCTELEFELQTLWGFERNFNYHRFWERPHCKCPRIDNEERLGTGYFIINNYCPLHGK